MAVSPITNFAKVDNDLWRGSRPDDAGLAWLLAQGVKTIINLEWEQTDDPLTGVTEVRLADWEPLPLTAPRIEDRHIVSFLAEVRAAVKPCFVHCHDGQNRTGIAVAAYRIIIKGDPFDAVISDMKSFGGLWAQADVNYVSSLANRKTEFI